jgi:hypothetical protein
MPYWRRPIRKLGVRAALVKMEVRRSNAERWHHPEIEIITQGQ